MPNAAKKTQCENRRGQENGKFASKAKMSAEYWAVL